MRKSRGGLISATPRDFRERLSTEVAGVYPAPERLLDHCGPPWEGNCSYHRQNGRVTAVISIKAVIQLPSSVFPVSYPSSCRTHDFNYPRLGRSLLGLFSQNIQELGLKCDMHRIQESFLNVPVACAATGTPVKGRNRGKTHRIDELGCRHFDDGNCSYPPKVVHSDYEAPRTPRFRSRSRHLSKIVTSPFMCMATF